MISLLKGLDDTPIDIESHEEIDIHFFNGIYHMNQFLKNKLSYAEIRTKDGSVVESLEYKIFKEAPFDELEDLKQNLDPLIIADSNSIGTFFYVYDKLLAQLFLNEFSSRQVTNITYFTNKKDEYGGLHYSSVHFSKSVLEKAKILDLEIDDDYNLDFRTTRRQISTSNAYPEKYMLNNFSNQLHVLNSSHENRNITRVFNTIIQSYSEGFKIDGEKFFVDSIKDTEDNFVNFIESKLRLCKKDYQDNIQTQLEQFPVNDDVLELLKTKNMDFHRANNRIFVEDYVAHSLHGSLFLNSFNKLDGLDLLLSTKYKCYSLPFESKNKQFIRSINNKLEPIQMEIKKEVSLWQ